MSGPDVDKLAGARPQDLLALYARIIEELLGQGVVRSTNNPAADYGEYLVAAAFDASLVANATIGFDAIDRDGVRYQVKARRLTTPRSSRQLGFVRGLDKPEDPFDVLVGILFNTDFTILRAAMIPIQVVRDRAVRVDYVNGWRFMLRDAVWQEPGVVDVTDRIRKASETHAVKPVVVAVYPSRMSEDG